MSSSQIDILQQRRIEAAVIKPLVAAFESELGPDKTREILTGVIVELAHQTGKMLRQRAGSDDLPAFAGCLEPWFRNDSLSIELLTLDDECYEFNVTRCRYAEMYTELGLADLGFTLSCNRDAALIAGFSQEIELTRTQTLMEGASHCDFRYQRRPATQPPDLAATA